MKIIVANLLIMLALWQTAPALAILPPHGPNLGTQSENNSDSGIAGGSASDSSLASLFLMRSNPKERMDALVEISNLNDEISHIEDPSSMKIDFDLTKVPAERRAMIERLIAVQRLKILANRLTQRGTLLAVIGERNRAIADLGEALDSDNSYAPAYNNRACLKAAAGDFDGALVDATKALLLAPNFAEAYDTRGAVYLAKKQYEQARKDFDRAIATRPHYAEAFYHRSLLMQALGKHDDYAADFKKARDLGYLAVPLFSEQAQQSKH